MKSALVLVSLLAAFLGAHAAAAHSNFAPIAKGDPGLASAQVALRDRGLYRQTVDGLLGPETRDAISAFQHEMDLTATGVLDAPTRQGLDAPGTIGGFLAVGARGLAVAALQFRLAWHGFPSGPFATSFSPRIEAALKKFQVWAGLVPDGVAGTQTLLNLRKTMAAASVPLSWPLVGVLGDRFGPRGARFHTGVDIAAPTGTPVGAAAVGVVVQAGVLAGGWGKTVTVEHAPGVETLYAHLSSVTVRVGDAVRVGEVVGLVGSTGDATGPHLHFEEQVRGAAVDLLVSLPPVG